VPNVVRGGSCRVGSLEDVSPRVFLDLRRTHEYRNLHSHKLLYFCRNAGTFEKRRFFPLM
jgi:hypothetical protein